MHEQPLELPQRILVIERDADTREHLREVFERCEVVFADDGVTGLAAIDRHRPEFIITDLDLPELSGLELIARARHTFIGACVPILVLTSSSGEDSLLESFRVGADDFMVKPFSLSELQVRISSIHLRQMSARDINPLTRLPGNMVLKREIAERIRGSEPVAIAHIDIDHFKPFNDAQGFDRGDHVIQLLGDLLADHACQAPPGEQFVGHVGGDDFVMILPVNATVEMGDSILGGFAEAVKMLYTPEEVGRGSVAVVNRQGKETEVPLLSLSIGVVTTAREGVDDVRKVASIAAEVKHVAKSMPGNSLFIDRRKKWKRTSSER